MILSLVHGCKIIAKLFLMKYFIVFWIVLMSFSAESFAQRWKRERHHLIFGMGASGFMGDLGGADQIGTQGLRDFDFAAVRPAITLGHRYLLLEDLALATQLTLGYVSGNDQHTAEPFRNNRNIHFRSPIIELSPQLQYYFVNFTQQGARHRRATGARTRGTFDFNAYVFAGVAGFYFNPQAYFEAASYNGTIAPEDLPADGWYNLRPLRTEGQGFFPTRKKYSPVSVSIPFGLGTMVQINRNMAIGLEFGYRKTFTDYIDDVSTTYVDPAIFSEMFTNPQQIALAEFFANPSQHNLGKQVTAPGQQRGNPYSTDTYMFTMITVYYRMPQARRPYGVPRF